MAVRFATVGFVALQKGCAAVPVGAVGFEFTVAVTSNLVWLSQPFVVCVAK